MSSYVNTSDAVCQECEKRFNINLRFSSVINLDIDGFEKDGFLNGSLNRIKCPFCNTEFTFEIPLVIFSVKNKFAYLVCPNLNNTNEKFIKNTLHLFLPNDFKFRLVRYLIEAKEKYDIHVNLCDDIIIEYIKLCVFSDEEAMPFDKRNIVFKAKNNNEYIFEQIDYNDKVLNTYKINFNNEKIPDYVKEKSYKLNNTIWHKIERISLKEELQCQNIKISL